MNNIDFLPKRYHERDVRRRAAIWRYTLLLSFGGVLCAATVGQFALRRSVQASLKLHQEAYISAQQKNERIAAMQAEIAELEQRAQLYTYLRHPWPRTRLLQAISQSIPDSVTLLELQFSQARSAATSGLSAGSIRLSASDEQAGPPSQLDLDKLRAENDSFPVTIYLTGTASDTAALNRYVGALSESPLISSATLAALEAVGEQERNQLSQFQINIVVRPGYGQPGGPQAPLNASQAIAAALSESHHE